MHVERGLALVVGVHPVAVVEVVGGCGDPRAAVPVVLARGEVHERSVHHDGFAGQVIATVASQVTVFHKSIAEGTASR